MTDQKRPKILWVDDSVNAFLGVHLEEVREAGYDVDVMGTLADAMGHLKDDSAKYDLLIWEIFGLLVGAASDAFSEEVLKDLLSRGTSEFNATTMHQRFREVYPKAPIILLTAQKRLMSDWHLPAQRRYALCKRDVLPDDLVAAIRKALEAK